MDIDAQRHAFGRGEHDDRARAPVVRVETAEQVGDDDRPGRMRRTGSDETDRSASSPRASRIAAASRGAVLAALTIGHIASAAARPARASAARAGRRVRASLMMMGSADIASTIATTRIHGLSSGAATASGSHVADGRPARRSRRPGRAARERRSASRECGAGDRVVAAEDPFTANGASRRSDTAQAEPFQNRQWHPALAGRYAGF